MKNIYSKLSIKYLTKNKNRTVMMFLGGNCCDCTDIWAKHSENFSEYEQGKCTEKSIRKLSYRIRWNNFRSVEQTNGR